MDSKQLYKILSNTYETAMTEERGWEVYSNFINLFKLGEVDTTEYLLDLITLNKNERLLYRHSLAEQGFELTPNEVNQYCLLLVVAMGEVAEMIENGDMKYDIENYDEPD